MTKGQKVKKYTPEVKAKVLAEVADGGSVVEVCKANNVNPKTYYNWVSQVKSKKNIDKAVKVFENTTLVNGPDVKEAIIYLRQARSLMKGKFSKADLLSQLALHALGGA